MTIRDLYKTPLATGPVEKAAGGGTSSPLIQIENVAGFFAGFQGRVF